MAAYFSEGLRVVRRLKILVRSRKDASAVQHAVDRIIKDPHIIVEHLSGARGEAFCKAVEDKAEPFTLLLLGERDPECPQIKTPFFEPVRSNTKSIRNLPLSGIVGLISRGRAGIRLRGSYRDGQIVLAGWQGKPLVPQPIHPEGDSFLLLSEGLKIVSELLGGVSKGEENGGGALLYKMGEGEHWVYTGERRSAILKFPRDKGNPIVEEFLGGFSPFRVREFLERNKQILTILEDYSIETIRALVGGKVAVPLSGGKDSAAALLLSVKALGAESVVAVYVDTGIDFPENEEYAERVTSQLGVDLIKVKAGVEAGLIREGLPLPSPSNRWCTGRKLEALYSVLKRLETQGIKAIVVGDRDAESSKRSQRPPMRFDTTVKLPVVAPLKYWSGAHVQAYLLENGLGLNRLYELGFVRTGCYLCFALRPSWELYILTRLAYYEELARKRPWQGTLIRKFLGTRLSGVRE